MITFTPYEFCSLVLTVIWVYVTYQSNKKNKPPTARNGLFFLF